jgi:colicin import membrane protein
MTSPSRVGAPLLVSLLLHAALALLLFYAARETVMTEPAPVSVELWSAAPPPPAVSLPSPVAVSVRQPVAATEPEPAAEQAVAKADIQLGHKERHPPAERKHEHERKVKAEQKPLPAPPLPAVVPVSKKKAKPEAKPAVQSKTLLPPVKTPLPDKPGKGQKAARHYNDDTNDLLSDLNSSNTSRPANARSNQSGGATGVNGGVQNGSPQARNNYVARVQAVVRPLVQLPADLKGNPMAVVRVQLLPTLEVQSVKLLQSSGNPAYDEAVQRAIWSARTFPALPAGLTFTEVRQLRLTFRPR